MKRPVCCVLIFVTPSEMTLCEKPGIEFVVMDEGGEKLWYCAEHWDWLTTWVKRTK